MALIGPLEASCVFPAGHVVQTTLPTRAATMTIGGSEDPTWTDSVVTSTITPKFSNSSIICCINIQAWFGVKVLAILVMGSG